MVFCDHLLKAKFRLQYWSPLDGHNLVEFDLLQEAVGLVNRGSGELFADTEGGWNHHQLNAHRHPIRFEIRFHLVNG